MTPGIPLLPPSPVARRHPAWRLAVTALLLLACALWIDRPLTLWIHGHVSPTLDRVFDYIGLMGDAEFSLVPALLLYIWSLNGLARGWHCPWQAGFERSARGALLLMLTMAMGGVITWLLKRLVSRARPEELLDHGIYGLGSWFSGGPYDSFPSSHTQAAFATAAVLAILAPRWRWPVLTLAALVGLSRLINRDHYLTDVLTAATIALCCAAFLAPRVLDSRARWPLRAPWRWFSRP